MARRRSAARTFEAWIVTGPVGHLVAGTVDWVGLVVRVARSRARERARP